MRLGKIYLDIYMGNFVLSFTQLTKKDVAIAGGKGASLGEMTRAGIPVPPGFVVLASSFERFFPQKAHNTVNDFIV